MITKYFQRRMVGKDILDLEHSYSINGTFCSGALRHMSFDHFTCLILLSLSILNRT